VLAHVGVPACAAAAGYVVLSATRKQRRLHHFGLELIMQRHKQRVGANTDDLRA
jgi:hypothetical protein